MILISKQKRLRSEEQKYENSRMYAIPNQDMRNVLIINRIDRCTISLTCPDRDSQEGNGDDRIFYPVVGNRSNIVRQKGKIEKEKK